MEGNTILLALAVTKGIGYERGNREGGMNLDFTDIRRAFFQALAKRNVYVELPKVGYERGMCRRLKKAMYGMRDAAQNWEWEYPDFVISQHLAKILRQNQRESQAV